MKVGIIGAMKVEVESLVAGIDHDEVSHLAGMEFHEGTLEGVPVAVVRCGVGKVNAAVCAEALAVRFNVTHVINTGVAGSLNARLDIGDILVSRDAVHHDLDVTTLGYAKGEVPGLPVVAFPASAELVAAVSAAVRQLDLGISCIEGRVASGDQFVGDQAQKELIARDFQADCCEMEGASIAHACWLNGIPFAIVRAISDKADGSARQDYPSFERKAAHDCAAIVRKTLGELTSNG